MILLSQPAALLLLIPTLAFTVAVWRGGFTNLGSGRRWASLVVRSLLVLCIVFGLAGLQVRLPQSREATVFLADLSASDVGSSTSMQALINAAVTHRPSDDRAGVVTVGRDALVEQPTSALTGFDGFQTPVEPDYTNLQRGLELAGAVLPTGYRKRVVVLSDGRQNVGDALAAARLLRAAGVRVDVSPVQVPGGPEVRVDRVQAPSAVRPREHFSLVVQLVSNVPSRSRVDLYRDRTHIATRDVTVPVGNSAVAFGLSAPAPGPHTFTARITPAQDTLAQNNTGSALITVQGAPRVLVIAADPTQAVNVMASLRTTGIAATLQRPLDVVPTLGYLAQYAAVVIVNTAADAIGPALQTQFVPYVRDLGHGLVVLGGQEAFGMGGYAGTPLETVLPVSMDLPKRKDLPSAAVVLIIENLEGDTEVNISKAAGKGVVGLLNPGDMIAVSDAPGDGTPGWAVPLQHVTNKAAIDHAIDSMQPGDPMSYAEYLQDADLALKGVHARVKHIIVLGDGDAEDPGYASLAARIRASGITISTVATNGLGLADFATMQRIAQAGGGRSYRADNTAAVPKIFLREARTVSRSGIIEGKFYPRELSANGMIRDLSAVPPLYGYVGTTPKPTGEIVLASAKLDPILAGWQFGAGRAVAWTSDTGGRWTRDWLQAPNANRFWADLVAWTFPAAGAGQLFVAASSSGGSGTIAVSAPGDLGVGPVITARVLGPDLRASTVTLQADAPRHFVGTFSATAQGAYFVSVDAHGAGHSDVGTAGVDVPYSAEYRVAGTDRAFLQALATAGGGSVLTAPSGAWADNLASVWDDRSLTDLLWLLALLLLPIDIGVRRLVITRQDLRGMRVAVRSRGTSARPTEPAAPALAALRSRRAQTRRPAAGAGPLPTGVETQVSAPGDRAEAVPAPQKPASGAAEQAEASETTAGRLLAARKRKR